MTSVFTCNLVPLKYKLVSVVFTVLFSHTNHSNYISWPLSLPIFNNHRFEDLSIFHSLFPLYMITHYQMGGGPDGMNNKRKNNTYVKNTQLKGSSSMSNKQNKSSKLNPASGKKEKDKT